MPFAESNSLSLHYELHGSPSNPLVLLISGLGTQKVAWPKEWIEALVSKDLHVLTFDNRDVGLSTHLDHLGVPDAAGVFTGETAPPYLISDMAADAAGLLEALSFSGAHVVGVSMGGMIAQQFAIDHPTKTLSLTSIMSTPAPMEVGEPSPEALELLFRPRPSDYESYLADEYLSWDLLAGPVYKVPKERVEQLSQLSWPNRNPAGATRQLAAIGLSPDRRPGLRTVQVPSLVLHGEVDPLVNISGGEATAAALPNATFIRYEHMGHALHDEYIEDHATRIAQLVKSVS